MPMSDEEEAKLKKEYADLQAQHKDLLAKQTLEANDAKAKEDERTKGGKSKERAGGPLADPDTVKELAELKKDMAEIKAKLGAGSAAPIGRLNFFGE